MKSRYLKIVFSFSASLFSFLGLADVPSTGNSTVDTYFNYIDNDLSTIQGQTLSTSYTCTSKLRDAENTYAWILDRVATGTYQDYYSGMKEGASLILNDFRSANSTVQGNCENVLQGVSDARSNLTRIALAFNSSSNDYSLIIQKIQEFQDSFDDKIGTVQTNQLVAISNLHVMVSFLKNVFPPATNELGQAVVDLDGNVHQLCIDFAQFWVNADNLLEWMLDEEQAYQQFFSTAVERMKTPDSLCQQSLRDMWIGLLDNRTRLVSVTNMYLYTIDDQVNEVLQSIDPNSFRLSNEGVIALENLAVNQRNYLCLAELVNRGSGSTSNYVDLAWITNYLGNVQKPYYELWDMTFNRASAPYNPYQKDRYQQFTNLIQAAESSSSQVAMQVRFNDYKHQTSNYWERLETYMLNLQGLIPTVASIDSEEEYSVQSNLDEENVRRTIEYSTNSFSSVVQSYGSVSNSLNDVFGKFKQFLRAFEMPDVGWDGVIRLTPQFELGGITIDPIYLDETHYGAIKDTVRTVFVCIWYGIFVFLGVRMVLLVMFLLGRTIAHLTLVLSTILS